MKKEFDAGKLLEVALGTAFILALAYLLIYLQGTDGFPEEATRLGQLGDFFGGILNPTVSVLTLFVAIFVVARMPSTSGDYPVQYSGKEAVAQYVRGGAAEQLRHFDESGYGAWTQQFNQVRRREDLIPFWCTEVTKSLFDHYFRVVFRILSEAEALLGDQHIRYIELFHAQLSRSELIILAYNLWLDDEGKKMIPLAEKYGLLKHLPKGYLRTTLEQELSPRVFGHTRAAELAATSPTPSIEEAT